MPNDHAHNCPTCGQSVLPLGQRILACRTAKNWTREEASERVDVLPSRWANWEMDVMRPSQAQQVALAELFGLAPTYFAPKPLPVTN
ncbi:helix-turn-helix domain-containing protein [Pseudomonas quasicaspiana]|uniref:helix-turn-helix domain-containing protein n=1 Tax=Pseudomonas quasicaspiana TaxID=2829821 RepID=UPI001E5B9913|nr:helix-turn-helix transcriptional regulator [Pseudomonas quasicaspiana]MCD5980534.1 helix-turn-helix transcriptional regulator [Pseudomonas quasicaspiana]